MMYKDITAEEAETFRQIAEEFIANMGDITDNDRLDRFDKDFIGISQKRMRAAFNNQAEAPYKKAMAALWCCELLAQRGVMKEAFNENAMLKAIRPEAQNAHFLAFYDRAGARHFAALCRKAESLQP